jgi:hypothetical protein
MFDGNLPNLENGYSSNIKFFLQGEKTNTLNSEIFNSENNNINQKINDQLFDYFNDLRSFPNKYLDEAKKYDLQDIISSAIDIRISKNYINLIKNSFFNLFLDTYVQKTPFSKETILKNINKNKQLTSYRKILYRTEAPKDDPCQSIWNLLKENKDIALNYILLRNIDYFIVSTYSLIDRETLLIYFLFLDNKNNN